MGHAIEYLDFDGNTTKREMENEANEIARRDGDYHSGLDAAIRWLDEICEDRDRAEEYIDSRDKGWYDQLAVRYRVYPKLEDSKTLLTLRERLHKEYVKLEEYRKAHSVRTFKAEYIGCPKCGSKLKRELLRGERCVLCGTDMRSKTTLDTVARYEENIKELNKKIKEEERKIQLKNIKKAKTKWLVKIEYHV